MSQPYSSQEIQEKLSERFQGLCRILQEFLQESPSRTGACQGKKSKLYTTTVRHPTPRSHSKKKSCCVYHVLRKIREKGIHHRSGKKGIHHQRTGKGASGKGLRQKASKIVKEVSKYLRRFSTFLAQRKKRQESLKSVKHTFDFFDHFRAAPVFRPLFKKTWFGVWPTKFD